MDKAKWESTAAALGQKIANDITYVFGVFVSYGEAGGPVSPFKLRVAPKDRIWLDLDPGPSLLRLGAKSFITPYDILTAKVTDDVTAFYSGINPVESAGQILEKYPEKAAGIKAQFQTYLDTSMQSTIKALTEEINRCVLQKKDIRDTIAQVKKVLEGRMAGLENLLSEMDRQLKKYVILWEYSDKGYERYIYIAVGENCETCQKLDGKIFNIEDAKMGVNLAPMHTHCDCFTGILDKDGNIVALITGGNHVEDAEKSNKILEYLKKSFNQLILGHYTEDITLLGTLGQIALGLVDLDLPTDIRDLIYDLTNWKWTWGSAGQTAIDAVGLIPVIGALKYTDEVGALIKGAAKYGDEAADIAEGAGKVADDVIDGIKVVDGKVGGKIPVDEYDAIRKVSVKNPEADSITLGKYTDDATSYTKRAGDSSYFDMGDDWSKVQDTYGLTDDEMFEYFNKSVLDDAIREGKSIKFSHNPLDHEGTSLWKEWIYIKDKLNLDNSNLIFEGGFWYVK